VNWRKRFAESRKATGADLSARALQTFDAKSSWRQKRSVRYAVSCRVFSEVGRYKRKVIAWGKR